VAPARTRIDIERAIRELLDKNGNFKTASQTDINYAGVNQLADILLRQNPHLRYLRRSFRYVTQICNAAIHAQVVSDLQAEEALALGAEILTALKQSTSAPLP